MPLVNDYHTTFPEYSPEQRQVYHNKNSCPDGKQIKPEHLASGRDGRRLCYECPKVF